MNVGVTNPKNVTFKKEKQMNIKFLKKIAFGLMVGFAATNCNAYVTCDGTPDNIGNAVGPDFHGFSESGATGPTFWVVMPAGTCTDSANGVISSVVYVLLTDITSSLSKVQISSLLAANAQKSRTIIHLYSVLNQSNGLNVGIPYYIGMY